MGTDTILKISAQIFAFRCQSLLDLSFNSIVLISTEQELVINHHRNSKNIHHHIPLHIHLYVVVPAEIISSEDYS